MNSMPLNMECLHVNIVITLLGEILAADGALVGCLPRVDPDVVIQVVFPEESLPTKHTLVLLFTRMLTHM